MKNVKRRESVKSKTGASKVQAIAYAIKQSCYGSGKQLNYTNIDAMNVWEEMLKLGFNKKERATIVTAIDPSFKESDWL